MAQYPMWDKWMYKIYQSVQRQWWYSNNTDATNISVWQVLEWIFVLFDYTRGMSIMSALYINKKLVIYLWRKVNTIDTFYIPTREVLIGGL